MKNLLVVVFMTVGLQIFAQTTVPQLPQLSKYDLQKISELPLLELSSQIRNRDLPAVVDNSALIYFRPLIAQVGLECGQASSIGVMFTYEMNFLRNANGSEPENQYPTHFAYNFLNGGSDAGVNFWETFEILRQNGTPNVADYGGMSNGGPSRWISGYENYFHGMRNRISSVMSIRTNTFEGLQTLKNWVYDHGRGDASGGIATFYSEFNYPPTTLPDGTPEAGKHVIIQWGNSPNHAMSIVGYNDSIRWDYNNDGQYTNDVDINADGVVNISDWEIGGFKMANTYGSISGWGDDGFSYMMYKSVADRFQQGGIWDNRVAILDVKADHDPKLTAKVKLTHNCRSKIKVNIGVSTDPEATEPEYLINYPIVDFQGGCKAMQGNSGVEEIEFGLDLNLLLMHLEPGAEARFFLHVYEDDLLAQSEGIVNSFSLVDYNSIQTEIMSEQSNIEILNNSVTVLTVNHIVNHDAVSINDEDLPPLQLYQPYETQLTATGGTPPYKWKLIQDYDTLQTTEAYPLLEEIQLSPSNNNDGTVEVQLPFDFSFFGKEYESVFVSVDGFLRFEQGLSPWPYYIDGRTFLKSNVLIAPCLSKPFVITPANGDGIWYSENEDFVGFRWKLSVSGQTGDSQVNLLVKLFRDGTVSMNFGEHMAASYVKRYAGISAGDGEMFVDLHPVGPFHPVENMMVKFIPSQNTDGILLSPDGMLSATIENYQPTLHVRIQAMDANNLRAQTTLTTAVEGVRLDYTIQSGGDNQADFGELLSLDMEIENLNGFDLTAGTLSIETDDPYLEILNGEATIEALMSGQTAFIGGLFEVQVAEDVQNGHVADVQLTLTTNDGQWIRHTAVTLYAAVIRVATMMVDDGENGILEPGETAQLIVKIHNDGGAALHNVHAQIACNNPNLSILSEETETAFLAGNSDWEAEFTIELSEDAPPMELLLFQLSLSADHAFAFYAELPLMTSIILENYETGNFDLYDWQFSGQAEWFITDEIVYEGNFSARSGVIGDNYFSALSINYPVAYDDSISFYYMVSSENNYDYLKFKMNNQEVMSLSGEHEWQRAAFPVSAGEMLFSWVYEKDYSVSNGFDCAGLDYIVFPARTIETSDHEAVFQPLQLIISPNPALDKVIVRVDPKPIADFQLLVMDSKGIVVARANHSNLIGQGEIMFSLSPLPAGVYSVCLLTKDQRIVKQLLKF